MTKAQVKSIALTVCVVGITFWVGFMAGFFEATGRIPFYTGNDVALPPSDIAKVTAAEAEATLAPLRDRDYGPGFNCLDYAWAGMRMLHWQGQMATIVRLDLEPNPDHAVLLVPTEDAGWVFLEPQTGAQIYPRVKGTYQNLADIIIGIDVMDITWIPINEYVDGIANGTLNGTASYSIYQGG